MTARKLFWVMVVVLIYALVWFLGVNSGMLVFP